MRTIGLFELCLALFSGAWLTNAVAAAEIVAYRGMCEASAAAALDRDHFAVASDEDNTLRIYKRGEANPVGDLDLAPHLGTAPGKGSDFEGAAAIGDRIYWITSHSLTKNGKLDEGRFHLVATDIRPGDPPSLVFVDPPYKRLLDDMVAARHLAFLGLDSARRRKPEARSGLNIEGLAATPSGALMIGFRNPHRGSDEQAIVVTLDNPDEVMRGGSARFGAPIILNLGGRGIRSIDRVGAGYLIVAGPRANDGDFVLYRWSGEAGSAPRRLQHVDLGGLHPEALFAIPDTNDVQILSDDGGERYDDVDCSDGAAASKQAFRSITVTP